MDVSQGGLVSCTQAVLALIGGAWLLMVFLDAVSEARLSERALERLVYAISLLLHSIHLHDGAAIAAVSLWIDYIRKNFGPAGIFSSRLIPNLPTSALSAWNISWF